MGERQREAHALIKCKHLSSSQGNKAKISMELVGGAGGGCSA